MKPNINPIRAVVRRLAVPCAAAAIALALPATALADTPVRLMVDPGHGGKDPGAVSGSLQEKNSNLTISKMVVESAKRQGWDVAMTRKDDRFIPLNSRPAKAKAFKATAMVSVHSNSAGKKATGNMTIYKNTKGKRLGRNIMDHMAPLTDYEDIGNRPDSRGLAVLRGSKVPTVIVEVLSVSNREENKALRSPAKQREAAEAIVAGVAGFHGVPYEPLAEVKTESESKADAPEEKPEAAEPKATPEQPKAETEAPASEPTPVAPTTEDGSNNTTDESDKGGTTSQRATLASGEMVAKSEPAGEAGWLGRFLRLLVN